MYKIRQTNLNALFRKIADVQDLILPVRTAGQTNFRLWTEDVATPVPMSAANDAAAEHRQDARVDLATLKTVKSGKDAFFPQSETLYTCVRENKKLKIVPETLRERPFVVFGMKACDVKGLEVLDRVFLAEPVDSFYAARREHGTIVAMACHEPEESCFCRVFGTDCAEPGKTTPAGGSSAGMTTVSPSGSEGSDDTEASAPGADVATWMVGGDLFWKPLTQKGEALTGCVKELLEAADAADGEKLDAEKASIRAIVAKLPYMDLSLDGWDGNATDEKFNSPLWETLYKPCLGCGTCTFVCPTCQCYDIKDYDTGHGIQRYRCWDSCMYSDFTMMAAGNNRTTQMQRFRQRFMHKLVYFPANNDGMYSCVGCGRCVEKCPQALNIVKVIRAFQRDAHLDGAKAETPPHMRSAAGRAVHGENAAHLDGAKTENQGVSENE